MPPLPSPLLPIAHPPYSLITHILPSYPQPAFRHASLSARAMSRRGGSASERLMHYLTSALARRLHGTAYDHFIQPVQRTKKVNMPVGLMRCPNTP